MTRVCPACGEPLVLDEETVLAGQTIKVSFKCEACAHTVLVLGPTAMGALLGCALVSFFACLWYAVIDKYPSAAGSLSALALGLFFAFLAYLRIQDDRKSRPGARPKTP